MGRRKRSRQCSTKDVKARIVYTSSVEDYIALADDDTEGEIMRRSDEYRAYVVYTKQECELLKGKPIEVVRLCHTAKRLLEGTLLDILPGSTLTGLK